MLKVKEVWKSSSILATFMSLISSAVKEGSNSGVVKGRVGVKLICTLQMEQIQMEKMQIECLKMIGHSQPR